MSDCRGSHHMNITFHLPVAIKGRIGKGINERTIVGYVPVEHDVPELSSFDAPLALSYAKSDVNGFWETEEFWGFEGRLYHAIAGEEGPPVVEAAYNRRFPLKGVFERHLEFLRPFVELRGSGERIRVSKEVGPASFVQFVMNAEYEYRFEPILGMDLKGDHDNEVLSQIEAFRRTIKDLVIIDGKFCLPEPEPILVVTENFGAIVPNVKRHHELGEIAVPKEQGTSLTSVGYFRLDQADVMEVECSKLAAGGRVWAKVKDISVYDASLLNADVEGMTLAELAATFAQRFLWPLVDEVNGYEVVLSHLGKELADIPIDQVALYQRLIRGIGQFKENGDTTLLEETVLTILESAPRSNERRYFVYQGNVARYADEIVRRWHDREVKLDSELSSTTPMP